MKGNNKFPLIKKTNKAMRNSLLVTAAVISLVFCNSPKRMAGVQAPRYFVLGSGGGFTEKYDIYKIHNDGRVEVVDAAFENATPLKTLSLDSTYLYFELLDKLDLQNLKFSYPDNMTWFIEVNNSERTNRISWGDLSHPVRPDIDSFFKRVIISVKTNIR